MDGNNYSAVPPPPSLSAGDKAGAPSVDFNDALSKARAIAEKLKQQSIAIGAIPSTSNTTGGTKRSYEDDNEDGRSTTSSKSYGSYNNDRESKRSAYDSGSSRPSFGNYESRRYGLGSEERKSSYGSSTAPSVHQEELTVPNQMVGLIIGKGGESLKRIERLAGVKDQIRIGRDMINQIINDAQSNSMNGNGNNSSYDHANLQHGQHSTILNVPVSKVGLVIGRGGETIRDFEERSKAKILIASDSTGDINNERAITLVGDDTAIKHAKGLIEDIVYGNGQHARSWGQGDKPYGSDHGSGYGRGEERIYVTIPTTSVGLIIGRGGETVRALQEQSGARIKVDATGDRNSEERTVNISGDPQCVAIAKQLVEAKVAEGQQYNQYYSQYGYDQSQYSAAGQEGDNQYQQYPGYQYSNYPGYSDPSGNKPEDASKEQTKDQEGSVDKNGKEDAGNDNKGDDGNNEMSAYYGQFYGNQQMTAEQQEAYYQWYQQYYGSQPYDAYNQPQQGGYPTDASPNQEDSQQEKESANAPKETSDEPNPSPPSPPGPSESTE
ncbi:hypothetical protein BDB01DRAFT_842803 [Pilobolus umbonatus]|nr:hypothetical protein BDB01DRAFT_842803 [Pilobolus umbonatus]